MRIAYLSSFFPYRGGISHFNTSVYHELEKENTIKAFTFTRQYPEFLFPGSTQYVTENDKVEKLSAVRCLDTINPLTWFSAASMIKKYSPDLLLMKFWMPFFSPSLGTVARKVKKKTKVISILDNVIPHEKRVGDSALIKYFLRQNHGFVVMSDVVRNDLLSLKSDAKYLFHEHPLYNHFEKSMEPMSAKISLNIPSDKKVLLFFGFIRDYKGLDLLLKAVSLLDDSYVLIIAGESYGSFDKYQKQVEKLNIGQRIIQHVRYINDDEVPLFFSAADVCILPYKSATQSGITSVAYHFNLPIIANDVGGLKESIHHQSTGLIAEQKDADTLAILIRKYFSENYKEKFIPNILQLKEKLSWKHFADALVDFYNKL